MVTRIVANRFCGPFVWGVSDCCTCACDAFLDMTGIDPMADLRGRYASAQDAMAHVKARGGWKAMFRGFAAQHGLAVSDTGEWSEGALGLAKERGRYALVIGIPGQRWAAKIDGGFVTVKDVVISCRR